VARRCRSSRIVDAAGSGGPHRADPSLSPVRASRVRDLWRARHQQHDRHGQNRSRTYRCSSQRHLVRRADHIEQFVQHLVIRRLSRPDAVDLLISLRTNSAYTRRRSRSRTWGTQPRRSRRARIGKSTDGGAPDDAPRSTRWSADRASSVSPRREGGACIPGTRRSCSDNGGTAGARAPPRAVRETPEPWMFWRPPRLRNDGHERLRGAESRWTTRHERTDHATSSGYP
jgi:hypothetical protein